MKSSQVRGQIGDAAEPYATAGYLAHWQGQGLNAHPHRNSIRSLTPGATAGTLDLDV